jgi:hypothetical protein
MNSRRSTLRKIATGRLNARAEADVFVGSLWVARAGILALLCMARAGILALLCMAREFVVTDRESSGMGEENDGRTAFISFTLSAEE